MAELRFSWIIFVLLQILIRLAASTREIMTMPPLPILPLPSASQLKWQQRELIMFLHFGMNTFTDSEWGTGKEKESTFNPTGLNANQWANVAADAGFSLMILTTKHHDGFCLWPSQYTKHSVKNSPWNNGKGDVVREFVNAAETRGLDIGLYLSPWDRHDRRYGQELQYNEYYLAQLQELLTRYGSVQEIWFDGAKGSEAPNMTYYFEDWFSMVKELQGSKTNIFSDAGPDIRWVGDEMGYAGSTSWSTINRTSLKIGDGNIEGYLNTGDSRGTDWVPAECDVSIRPGWFWHKSELPKSLNQLLNVYYKSVGRNCVLLLNVPPNSTGLISNIDVQRLGEFQRAINTIFSTNLAEGSIIKASSQRGGKSGSFSAQNVLDNDHLWTYWTPAEESKDVHWIELSGKDKGFRFNVVRIQEAIGLGQRVLQHDIYADGKRVAKGTTVGYKRLHRTVERMVQARKIMIRIQKSRGLPLISSIGLHFDPFWHPNSNRNKTDIE